ncbi:MAG: ABC transporter ATP-binding protein [Clostridia bacterium]|nr:ABC transporter ATP-binding protein [Clostridia bacterium]
MIQITDLNKSFGNKKVLENLNCTIKTGSIYGLIGANGAGKSTLLRIIMGIFRKDSGKITIDDKELIDSEELKQKLCFVPDDLFFFKGYTIKDTINFYSKMYKNFESERAKKFAESLKLPIDKKISTFSKGMKRQVALICAICTNCDYMFFDETFDGIDPVIRNYLKKIIAEQMAKKETTIIMTSHNLRELEDICDNVGLLYKGGIIFESELDSLKTNMFKIQISLPKEFGKEDFENYNVLSFKKTGSVATIILKGDKEKYENDLQNMNPIILDFLPLTLEEIFIYQMEVLGYEFNEII